MLNNSMTTSLLRILPVTMCLYAIATLTAMAGMEIFGWLTAAVVIGLLVSSKAQLVKIRPLFTSVDVSILAFMFVVILGAFVVDHPGYPTKAIVGSVRFAILFVLIRLGLEMLPKSKIEKMFPFILGLVALIGLYAAFQSKTGIDFIRGAARPMDVQPFPGGVTYRSRGMFNHPVTFAHSMAITLCLPLAVLLTQKRERNLAWTLALFASATCLVGLMWSYTRGAWIGAAAALLVMCLYSGRRAWMAVSAVVVVAAITILLSLNVMKHRAENVASTTYASNSIRIDLWKANIAMFKDHPILGVGYGVNEDLVKNYFVKLGINQEFAGHAHNTFLQVLSGTGVAGFVPFALFCILALWMAHKTLIAASGRQDWTRTIALTALGAQIALYVGGMTECNFKDGEVNHQFMLWIALLTVYSRSVKTDKSVEI